MTYSNVFLQNVWQETQPDGEAARYVVAHTIFQAYCPIRSRTLVSQLLPFTRLTWLARTIQILSRRPARHILHRRGDARSPGRQRVHPSAGRADGGLRSAAV